MDYTMVSFFTSAGAIRLCLAIRDALSKVRSMTSRDRYIESALIGIGAGASGAVIGAMLKFGVSAGEAFTLAGAIIGATATVGGAIWVADRNSNIELAREVDVLLSDFSNLLSVVMDVKRHDPGAGEWSDAYRNGLQEFGWKVRGSNMIAEQAIERSQALNFRHRAALIDLRRMLMAAEQFFSDCYESQEEIEPWDERSWPQMIDGVLERTEHALSILKAGSRLGR